MHGLYTNKFPIDAVLGTVNYSLVKFKQDQSQIPASHTGTYEVLMVILATIHQAAITCVLRY